MYLFWFIPVLAVVVIGIWAFYRKIMKESGAAVRKQGKVLVDRPVKPPEGYV